MTYITTSIGVKVTDKSNKEIAYLYEDLNGKNVVCTERRYANDKPRMKKITSTFSNGLGTNILDTPKYLALGAS